MLLEDTEGKLVFGRVFVEILKTNIRQQKWLHIKLVVSNINSTHRQHVTCDF